ncbi:hypothetical protein M758_11G025400 [Ceratodon purpureus]|nr:hypothetical protein M758_11G025400 [Ceratodon purpureus]KAG0600335.1 hypothetical protein M758_11G025400 [Ceratodon purpureus]
MNPSRLMLPAPPPSEERAATIIQAHYRGLSVRRTHPLEHLHIIYQVRQDLKAHMLVLADPGQYEKLCSDPEQRLRWSECAMRLLLRLDSVQGAHAHVRDIRKMVTKEVIAFQEIVDSTSKDIPSDKQIVKSRKKSVPFQSLFFALQQQGWIFTSSRQLKSHR